MACEIYNILTDSRLLDVTAEPECRYEKGCPQTCEACIFGKKLRKIDQESKHAVLDDDDLAQSKFLAAFEAKCDAEKKPKQLPKELINVANLRKTWASIHGVN